MNTNRIEINGVWYVREDAIQDPIDFLEADEMSVTNSLRCSYDPTDWCFEASILLKENADSVDEFDIDGEPWILVTDKRSSDPARWIEHDIDNTIWMLGVLDGDLTSMEEADEIFDSNGLYHFKAFLRVLINKDWLKTE